MVVATASAATADRGWIIRRGDLGKPPIRYLAFVRYLDPPVAVDPDLRDPISYQQFVTWGRSMMGGDTSGMLDI